MSAIEAGQQTTEADSPAGRIASPWALLLLGWIGAIKATGASLATVSLVDAAQELALSPFMRSVASSAISLAIAATAVAAGVAADRLGRRRLLMWSYVLAAVAGIAVVLIPAGPVYVGGLLAAGVAYGAMVTGSYAYVKALAPGKSLGLGLGLFGISTTVVTLVTTLAGGALAFAGWRWLFILVPAMCLVSLVLTPRLLPVMPRAGSGPVDWLGLVLLGGGMMLVITGVSQVTAHPPERAGWLVILAGAGAFVAWVVVELRRAAPAFPVRIFRSRAFVAAVVLGLTGPLVTSAMALSVSDALQFVRQGSAFTAMLALEPFYVAGGVGGLIAGRMLSHRTSERAVMTVGPLIAAAGFLVLYPVHRDSAWWLYLPGVILAGAGIFAGLTAQGQVIVRAVSGEAYGAVTSSKTSIAQLGSALGMVLTMLAFKLLTAADLFAVLRERGVTEADVAATLGALDSGNVTAQQLRQQFPEALSLAVASFSSALHGTLLLAAAVMLATAAAVWLLMRRAT